MHRTVFCQPSQMVLASPNRAAAKLVRPIRLKESDSQLSCQGLQKLKGQRYAIALLRRADGILASLMHSLAIEAAWAPISS